MYLNLPQLERNQELLESQFDSNTKTPETSPMLSASIATTRVFATTISCTYS